MINLTSFEKNKYAVFKYELECDEIQFSDPASVTSDIISSKCKHRTYQKHGAYH